MHLHQRLQGLPCKNSKYEIDGLHCLQINQPLVYSLATPRLLISFSNIVIHSKLTYNSLDFLSASMFFFPGIWAAVKWIYFFSAHSQISFAKWWHMSEWEVPVLLIHPIAVVLSENTLILIFSSFMKYLKPRSLAFSSSALICNCSIFLLDMPLHEPPPPPPPPIIYSDIWL